MGRQEGWLGPIRRARTNALVVLLDLPCCSCCSLRASSTRGRAKAPLHSQRLIHALIAAATLRVQRRTSSKLQGHLQSAADCSEATPGPVRTREGTRACIRSVKRALIIDRVAATHKPFQPSAGRWPT